MTTRQIVLFALILLAYLVASVLYAVLTPSWQAPDEPAHYNYVRYLGTHTDFPELVLGCYDQNYLAQLTAQRFPSNLSIEGICYEYHQPPLYYLLLTPFFLLGNGSLLVLRLVSVLLGAGVVATGFFVANTIFPQNLALTAGPMALVAFVPMHTAILASVNNDALAELIFACILLLLVRQIMASKPPSFKQAMLLGVTVGLGLITKAIVHLAIPLVAVALLILLWQAKLKGRQLLLQAAIIYGLALLVALPWYLRNIGLYGGLDFLGLGRHNEVVVGQLRTTDHLAAVGPLTYIRDFFLTTFRSFWGQFGWMAVPMDTRTYRLLLLLSVVAGLGLALFLVQQWQRSPTRPLKLAAEQTAALGLLAVVVGLTGLAYVWYNLSFVQFQGRYLFPSLIPLGMFFALGLSEVLRPRRTWGLLLMLVLGLLWIVARNGLDKRAILLVLLLMAGVAARKFFPRYEPYLSAGLLVAVYAGLALLALAGPYWFVMPYL